MTVYHLDNLDPLYQHLALDFQMYQVIDSSGELQWRQSDGKQADRMQSTADKNPLPVVSPKSLFFGERENLFQFDGECFRETLPNPEPFALFGVRSCDLHAIAYQDQFFANDPYYQARRKKALLIGLDCLSPCRQGFCHSVDAGPEVNPDTTDLTLHREAANLWLLLVNSEHGEKAIQGLAMTGADKECYQRRQVRIDNCIQQFPDNQHISAGISALNHDRVSNDQWQALGQRSQTCSSWTRLCPTCSCYAIRDVEYQQSQEPDQNSARYTRQRVWDSCLDDGFQHEASQHNPSATAGERVRRFWYHKFSDNFANRFGRYGCVGCGRCEQTCPGGIGVHGVLRHISLGEPESELEKSA